MKIKIVISTLAAALAVACCSATVSAAPFQGRVQVQGKALVAGNGQRFMVRGVALAPLNINNDLLADNNFAYTRDNILPKLLGGGDAPGAPCCACCSLPQGCIGRSGLGQRESPPAV